MNNVMKEMAVFIHKTDECVQKLSAQLEVIYGKCSVIDSEYRTSGILSEMHRKEIADIMNEIEPIKIELLSQIISCMLSGSRMATNVSIFNNKDNGKYADSYIIYVSGKISLLIMGIGYNALSLPAFLAVYPPKEPVNIEEKRAAMLLWMNQVEAEFLTEEIEAARRVILQHLPTNIEEQHTDYIEKLQNPASYDANLLEKPEFSTMLSDFIEVVNEQKSSSSVSSVGMFRQAPEIEAVQDIQNTQQNVVRPSGCCVIS